jgi:hypothetical protein
MPDASLTIDGTEVIRKASGVTTLKNTTIDSNVNLGSATFPAGHILQTQSGTFNTQTSIGITAEAVVSLTFTTKSSNSTFYAHANACVGAAGDSEGYWGGICLNTGSAANFRQPMQLMSDTNNAYRNSDTPGSTSDVGNPLFGNDYGNGFGNGYQILFPAWSAEKTTIIAAGTTITIALWFRGVTTMYINRSSNRATHEGGITRLVVHEVQS